jgi:hypothetical protein
MRRLVGVSLLATIVVAGCGSSSPPFATPTTETRSTGTPTGAFTKVAEKTSDGLHWRLSNAPGAGGTTCYKLETGPSVDLIQSAMQCPNPPTKTATPDFNTEFPFETGATTAHDIVVAVTRHPINDAQIQFVVPAGAPAKTAKPVYIDKQNGVVVWAGKSRPFVGGMQITLSDNSKIDCGPGDVQSASQLSGKSDPDILKARQFVWSCIVDD